MEILRIYPKDVTVVLEMQLSEIDNLLEVLRKDVLERLQNETDEDKKRNNFTGEFAAKLLDVSETVKENYGT